MFQNKVTIVTN